MTRLAATMSIAIFVAAPALALPGFPLQGLLGKASDSALTKLSQPGAFFADEAVRIALPGPLKGASGIMKFADKAGLTSGLTKSINDAAGIAAGEAKPIFRTAISKMTMSDGISVARTKDGGTNYLQQSAGDELRTKVQPLIVDALGKTGAYTQLDKIGTGTLLGRVDVSRDTLTSSVTNQTMNGIFKYMASEEIRVRNDPVGNLKGMLNGLKGTRTN